MEHKNRRAPSKLVPHLRQQEDSDCGITCALMICRYFGLTVDYQQLVEAASTESIWTIHLAIVLHTLGVSVTMATALAGVSALHADKPFYESHFEADKEEVPAMFAKAAKLGIPVTQRSLTSNEFDSLVRSGVILIVLVDSRLLSCAKCESWATARQKNLEPDFIGHFIVVHGLTDSGAYRVIDPNSDHECCEMSFMDLNHARKSDGTDEDLIIVDPYSTRISLALQRSRERSSSRGSGCGVAVAGKGCGAAAAGESKDSSASGSPAATSPTGLSASTPFSPSPRALLRQSSSPISGAGGELLRVGVTVDRAAVAASAPAGGLWTAVSGSGAGSAAGSGSSTPSSQSPSSAAALILERARSSPHSRHNSNDQQRTTPAKAVVSAATGSASAAAESPAHAGAGHRSSLTVPSSAFLR